MTDDAGIDDAEIRDRLRAEHDRLAQVAEGIEADEAEPDTELSNYDQHQADEGSETATVEVDHAILDRVRSELDDVEAALRRLDEGTYGRCQACGEPIGEARLAELPAARYCLRHQQAAEAGDLPSARLGHL
jgi:DnaK suppressor protein